MLKCAVGCLFTMRHNEKGFAKVGDFEFRLPTTAADFCFVVDVYYFCLALFVEPELKLNRITVVDA